MFASKFKHLSLDGKEHYLFKDSKYSLLIIINLQIIERMTFHDNYYALPISKMKNNVEINQCIFKPNC